MVRSKVLAVMAALCIVGLGGCAVDDENAGDTTTTFTIVTETTTGNVGCVLGAKALSAVVGELKNGAVIGKVLGVLEPVVADQCAQVIENWIGAPDEPVAFTLEGLSGPQDQQASLSDLLSPPPERPPTTFSPEQVQRGLACLQAYDSYVLFDWCSRGIIAP